MPIIPNFPRWVFARSHIGRFPLVRFVLHANAGEMSCAAES